ncbi:hypothetical protein FKW77_006637 [Venturia effusa]|uniref:Uncharacterized protein n=1 Tax=Venturia effusa TaxID=50376 RepID=A0A517KWM7_9PEZI|nr:hypothetical protein FKW77_006637 [Venturia effusa]
MASSFRPLPPLPTSFASSHDTDCKLIVQNVKLLYMRRQYKQCANLCENHLMDLGSKLHPLYQVFLNFMAGLAYDTQARSMSTRSPLLPGTLDDAEQFFLRAQQVLPTALSRSESKVLLPILEREEDFTSSDVDDNSPRNSLNSQFSTTTRSTAATSVSGHPDDCSSSCESSPMKRPSPLFVRKYKTLPETPTKTLVDSTSLFSLATNPMLTSAPRSPHSPPKIASFNFPNSASSPSRNEETFASERDQIHEHNESILSFNSMISRHISSLQQFRKTVEAAHEIRRPTTRDGNGKLEMSPEETMERIVKARAKGWRRERFDPRKYEELCTIALSEL